MKKLSKIGSIMLYIFIIGIVCSFLLIKYFGDKVAPILISNGEAEAKRIITLIINNSISKDTFNGLNMESMLEIKRNSNDEIEMIDFNTVNVTEILETITGLIQNNLNAVEEGNIRDLDMSLKSVSDIDYEEIKEGIVYYIPMGNVSNSSLLSNIGPKIPIKFVMVGDVISNVTSDIREYGINNAMIVVSINISVTMLVNMSFVSREVNIETSVPVVMKVIQGAIPEYYLGSISSGDINNNE